MDQFKVQALIAQGDLVTASDIDASKSYLQVGVFQEGNRQKGPGNANAYAPYAIPVSEMGGTNIKTPLFQFFYGYYAVPTMIKTADSLEGPRFFGNNIKLKGYKVAGKITVDTGTSSFYYIGTVSANVPLNGTYPWKVSGQVETYDSNSGTWFQSAFGSGAIFTDNASGAITANSIMSIVEDYNLTPGSIELFLFVTDTSALGISGNVSFEYDIFVDNGIDLTFDNVLYP